MLKVATFPVLFNGGRQTAFSLLLPTSGSTGAKLKTTDHTNRMTLTPSELPCSSSAQHHIVSK